MARLLDCWNADAFNIVIQIESHVEYTIRMAMTQQLTVRMPVDVLRKLKAKGKTAPYIIEAVKEKMARDEEAEIEASLLCLADDDENDISDLKSPQAKALNRED